MCKNSMLINDDIIVQKCTMEKYIDIDEAYVYNWAYTFSHFFFRNDYTI